MIYLYLPWQKRAKNAQSERKMLKNMELHRVEPLYTATHDDDESTTVPWTR